MVVGVWVLLNRKVSVTTKEEPVDRAALALTLSVLGVLGSHHGVACDFVLRLSNHGCEGLEVGSGVPGVRTAKMAVRVVLGKAQSKENCGSE